MSREGLYLRKIESALSRIQNGSFGQCDDCGEEIEIKRLEARPTTTSCIACKEQEEKRERLFA
jgi:DnaK suppressor protein